MKKFLFVLCPPYSGSTVLWRLLQTSPHVSWLPKEGQFLDAIRPIMRDQPYNPDKVMPWKDIRKEWEKHWKPECGIWLEKSPPNLIRAFEIEKEFSPCYFVTMIRDPYAMCEGISRRNYKTLKETANFWVTSARYQKQNIEGLKNIVHFSYEDMVHDPSAVSRKVLDFLPELESLDVKITPKVHSIFGREARKITNFNQTKINQLSDRQLVIINEVLERNRDIMEYFGYSYTYPSFKRNIVRHTDNPLSKFNIPTKINSRIRRLKATLG